MHPYSKVITALLLFISISLTAQTVTVKPEGSRVKGNNTDGYAVDLEASGQDVENAFTKYLRTLGKLRMSGDEYVLTESTLSPGSKNPIYCKVHKRDNNSGAWMGIKEEEWGDVAGKVKAGLEKVLYDFGVKFYRDKIQLQIEESNRALQAVEKQQQRLSNEKRNLEIKVEDNKREKTQLETSLENNKTELESLTQRLEKNKHNQDSVVLAGDQIKKVLDTQKKKQAEVR